MSEIPYPGLRPFHGDEAHLFFGREEQTDELLRRLNRARFLAVVGPSGGGKSSLVRAGMISALESGFMVGAGSRWRVAVMRPGRHPLRRLAAALIEQAGVGPDTGDDSALGFLTASLWRGPLGLVDALNVSPLPSQTNLLILVDQFEEIFRFRREVDRDEADAFVSLLLDTVRQRDQPVYVVITMRSDFFGDCAVFTGLPQAINESQYLTPRLTREQRQAAIEAPARVCGGAVASDLVNHLLNEIGDDPDQLPVLQHLLMRMWTWRHAGLADGVPRSPQPLGEGNDQPKQIAMEDYDAVGGLKHALSNHADEAFQSLTDKQRRIAEVIFRRLSEWGEDQRAIRRPTRTGELAELCNASVEDVVRVADVFRAPGVSFLVPALTEPIFKETMLDISHESLIRQWQRLKKFAEEEGQSAETYRFLEQTARRWREGQAALWGTPNLDLALDWKSREMPTEVWARRYGGDFNLAMEFLNASEEARRDELSATDARRQREIRRLRKITVAATVAFLSVLGAVLWYVDAYVSPHEAYYANIIKRKGLLEGYGKLTREQVRGRSVSLKFVTQGRHGVVQRVEAVNGNGDCDPQNSVGTIFEYAPDFAQVDRECAWEFVIGLDGEVVYEKAFNKFGKLVWGFAYVPAVKGEHVRRAYFIGADGFPQPRKNSKAAIAEFHYDPETGQEVRVTYWDRERTPQMGLDRAYGRILEYYPNGLTHRIISLDASGEPMNDVVGNAIYEVTPNELGNPLEAIALDKDEQPVLVDTGYHRWTHSYDDRGNRTDTYYFDTEGKPTIIGEGYHHVSIEYDERGNSIAIAYFDREGQPTNHEDGYHREVRDYDDEDGWLIASAFFDIAGNPTINNDHYHRWVFEHNEQGRVEVVNYYDVERRPTRNKSGYHRNTREYGENNNVVSSAFFATDGRPAELKEGYHRRLNGYDERGHLISQAYFGVDGAPVVHAEGYHRWSREYDDFGNIASVAFYDSEGQPTASEDGHHKRSIAYDDRGNAVRTEYYAFVKAENAEPDAVAKALELVGEHYQVKAHIDLRDRRTTGKGGYHFRTNDYDHRGRSLGGAYFDTSGSPVASVDGYHRWSYERDERGNIVSTAFFDVDGKPMTVADGYHRKSADYDIRGNMISDAFFDVAGNPALHASGYHRRTFEYDERDRNVGTANFGAHDQPVVLEGGYHRWNGRVDLKGRLISVAYFDANGKSTLRTDGYHRSTNEYDEDGNVIATAYLGRDGEPTVVDDGYHRVTNDYDEHGNRVGGAFFDVDGKPVVGKSGYHRWVVELDSTGTPIAQTVFSDGVNPLHEAGGHQRTRRLMDDRSGGRAIEQTVYDKEGNLYYRNANGFARYGRAVELLDEDGRATQISYYDDGETPVMTTYYSYDSSGNVSGSETYGHGGEKLRVVVRVDRVLKGSQAERLGILAGDRVLRYDGRDIDTVSELVTATAETGTDSREVVVFREGGWIRFGVQPGRLGVVVSEEYQSEDTVKEH